MDWLDSRVTSQLLANGAWLTVSGTHRLFVGLAAGEWCGRGQLADSRHLLAHWALHEQALQIWKYAWITSISRRVVTSGAGPQNPTVVVDILRVQQSISHDAMVADYSQSE